MRSDTTLGRILLAILYISIVAANIVSTMFAISMKKNGQHKVSLGGQELVVSVADTTASQERGLGGVNKLGDNEGMLFVFSAPSRTGFWMKDMLIPIDIIWFDANRRIVDVWEDAQPDSYPEVRVPRSLAQYVLEVQSGFYNKHNLKLGNVLELDGVAGYNR